MEHPTAARLPTVMTARTRGMSTPRSRQYHTFVPKEIWPPYPPRPVRVFVFANSYTKFPRSGLMQKYFLTRHSASRAPPMPAPASVTGRRKPPVFRRVPAGATLDLDRHRFA